MKEGHVDRLKQIISLQQWILDEHMSDCKRLAAQWAANIYIGLFVTVYTFSFDCEPFVNIRIHIDYVRVFAAFSLLSLLFLFAVLFYLYTVLGYVWVISLVFT